MAGIEAKPGAITCGSAGVADLARSIVRSEKESGRVEECAAVVEAPRLELALYKRCVTNLRAAKACVPAQQVVHGGQHPAVTVGVFKGHQLMFNTVGLLYAMARSGTMR